MRKEERTLLLLLARSLGPASPEWTCSPETACPGLFDHCFHAFWNAKIFFSSEPPSERDWQESGKLN